MLNLIVLTLFLSLVNGRKNLIWVQGASVLVYPTEAIIRITINSVSILLKDFVSIVIFLELLFFFNSRNSVGCY